MKALNDRIQMMIGRAVLADAREDPQLRELQLELLADETQDGVEHFEPYGFTARAKAGAEAIMLAPGGLRSHGIAICVADRRYRLTTLAEGEVTIHDDQGQKVHLTRAGIIVHGKKLTLESEGDIVLDAEGDVTIDCANFTATATGSAELEGASIDIGHGASLEAARKTDTVAGGVINSGSGKVKIA